MFPPSSSQKPMHEHIISPLIFGSKTQRITVKTETLSEQHRFRRIANQLIGATKRKGIARETPIERLALQTSGGAEIVKQHHKALLAVAGLASIEVLEARASGGKRIVRLVPLPESAFKKAA
jgi:hypothetical protein